ncbi:hypothetical protein AMTRI_Chr02g265270 [Amborella trichopoda]|uniref:Uncharacterized protein n=1 Tax=Amborella trichopoda TaxID=13333 RepID=W1P3T3_AMBTC|nr:WD repeat-containing protein 89 homolog [Amborella trichopoda]XP_011621930.1 WD repeat-containing protein 89 homolog [Amborella trichopoda]ERN02221.1 hypothetical protein AMTR_s00045p00215170 [Amborella trichopoda]|eukprot:XP_006840546.1 WD repeat-containing protein 89 homolog [Amborella trichopoda]
MEMEVEEEGIPSYKRLGIRNTIQTNFGDDYVFQIASCKEGSSMAVSLSTNMIKLYSPETGQYLGECTGHSGTISEISFSYPSSSHVLCSSSVDGTLRAWDTRTFNQVSLLRSGPSQELFAFSFGGSSGNLLAAGSNAQILFWDWRIGKLVSCLEESHIDDVTQVLFAPNHQNKLISASVDGLLCTFDTDGQIDDDDNLESVMNLGTSIAKVGFFGETNQKLWCLTHIETLSIWDWELATQEADFQDARSSVSACWNLDQVDYFVDCHYSQADERLWAIGATNGGTLGYFPLNSNGTSRFFGTVDAVLEGGHSGVVRTIMPSSTGLGGSIGGRTIFGWTGGEDGRLCCWLSDEESTETNRSWVSGSLAIKSPKSYRKRRHHPY